MIRRRYIVAAALVSALIATPYAVAMAAADDLEDSIEDRPRNIAHRGASDRAPENTLEAFRLARDAGTGVLELDLHMTRDGRVVVIHDENVDRTTDGSGAVRDMTLEELRGLDAGYAFTPGGIPDEGPRANVAGEREYRGRAVRVPTLAETLQEFPGLRLNVEIKAEQHGVERAVLREIRRAGAEDRLLVASQETRVIRRFRELSGGEVETAASVREVGVFYALSVLRLEALVEPPYSALQVPVEHVGLELATRRFIEAAHSRGVRVDAWTIDDPDEMRRLLDLGADSIITNRPSELSRVLAEREADGG